MMDAHQIIPQQPPTTRTWTIAEYLDRAERQHLLQPDERALAEAIGRAWYLLCFLREDFPDQFSHESSAAKAIHFGIAMMEQRREGLIPIPQGEERRA
jgi:hypothetical protein